MFNAFQYHPAFDVYNCIFRMLRILICKEIKKIETSRLRLFDFYLVFPGLIKKIRIRPEHRRAKNNFSYFSNFIASSTEAFSKTICFKAAVIFIGVKCCQTFLPIAIPLAPVCITS